MIIKTLSLLALICICLSCGVKKPPLPPKAETPQGAEALEEAKKKAEERKKKD